MNPPTIACNMCSTQGIADHLFYGTTRSVCGVCKAVVDAKIVFRDRAVHLEKFCPSHGHQSCVISSSVEWYLDARRFLTPSHLPAHVNNSVDKGCPSDCGFCPAHQQALHLPLLPITSACNLDCAICYTINKNESSFYMSQEEFFEILNLILKEHGTTDVINFTGGEPTIHPRLMDFLEQCKDAGIKRLTFSSNGLNLNDEKFVQLLRQVDARVILSLDTFSEEVDKKLHSTSTLEKKKSALDLLTKYEVHTTVLPAIAAGLNDSDLPNLLQLVLERTNTVSLEIHTLCFTGQGGSGFDRSSRTTIPDLHDIISKGTQGRISSSDFVPSPLAHPQCYSICYILLLDDGNGYIPLARLMGRQKLYSLLQDSLYIEPHDELERVFLDLIDELWTNPERLPESDTVLRTLKRLIGDLFPVGSKGLSLAERRRIAEKTVKAIYIHSHMDEENFDTERSMKCCVGVPSRTGAVIPACSYNIMYREQDSRFADEKRISQMSRIRLGVIAGSKKGKCNE